jgi:2-C-methyl-D-erythritol 4-phosphate cytidylyltransferase
LNEVSAIVVAAGRGKRLGGKVLKQFLQLDGKPILYHTLLKFERCDLVGDVVIVAPEDWLLYVVQDIVDRFRVTKVRKVIPGGKERQDSVYTGLRAVEGDPSVIVIHDGVRPFVRVEQLTRVIEAARDTGAAILATRPKDTIKRGDTQRVHETYVRDALWAAQTPQAFHRDLITQAHETAAKEDYYATDDAALVERLGHPVTVVEGDETNIKITTEADLRLAEFFMREGRVQ